ncbi:coiled-coil domain-containing protein [Thiohalomonas denitrificans]|uniref:Chromosome partition protein Smc n=1 Tax=Thiohalomonas denitrificans TaxID=415747 RepID=A0A1G5Q8Y3_9GAMM|nr:hypothetical protein [Thiohalomonas denitrificans]SCZ57719.1 hypothetical protein SAMN03097708_01493 [Thiohalomonas denitrificans]
MDSQGFVDLRQNGHSHGQGESFWPSFTDIMMVVVMIFIITSTVLIVRNWELVVELQNTVAAERQAAALAASRQETNESLESQLARLQSELSEAHIRNLRLAEENSDVQKALADREQRILSLRAENQQLDSRREVLERRTAALSRDLERTSAERETLQAQYEQRGERIKRINAQLQQLEETLAERLAELGTVRQERAAARQQLAGLRADYETLDAKYQELIKPARTAEDREVVAVRYRRVDGEARIQLRGPGEAAFAELSEAELHERLSALKNRYEKELYVKIIIPSESGLSYNEAWSFTQNLLSRYDYYYQD